MQTLDMIEFICGSCGMALRLAARFSGHLGRCPRCRGTIGIPNTLPGAAGVAPRLCNACGGEIDADLPGDTPGEETFCRNCLTRMSKEIDGNLLGETDFHPGGPTGV